MTPSRSRYVGYALLGLGVVLCLVPFVMGGSTMRACPGIHSAVYDTIGIYPAGYEVTGVDLERLGLYWYDGCNSRSSSLVPLLIGVTSLGSGLAIVRRARGETSRASS